LKPKPYPFEKYSEYTVDYLIKKGIKYQMINYKMLSNNLINKGCLCRWVITEDLNILDAIKEYKTVLSETLDK